MKTIKSLILVVAVAAFMSSCTSVNRTMREPNTRVEFYKKDFTLSEQLSAEATSTKVFGIDFARLTNKESGAVQKDGVAADPLAALASIPVIGSTLFEPTAGYALHNLMSKNAGYDVVFYPQYITTVSKPILGLGFLKKITTVKTTARLAKFAK